MHWERPQKFTVPEVPLNDVDVPIQAAKLCAFGEHPAAFAVNVNEPGAPAEEAVTLEVPSV